MLIGQEHLIEVPDAEGAVVPVEPGPTWREALSARVRPSDGHVSADEIFAILNSGSDADTAAALYARGITVPMYCVWKSKYRQLPLNQLRKARRREQFRRSALIGLALFTAVLVTGGIAASLVWAVASTFKGLTESTLAIPAGEFDYRRNLLAGRGDASEIRPRARTVATSDLRSAADAMATMVETGYRIQVKAAESAREGREFVARLASQGYPAYMTRAVVGNSDVFRVRVGPFDTLTAAEEIATRLRSDGYGGAWIAR